MNSAFKRLLSLVRKGANMSERNGKYYTLAIWNEFGRSWSPEFGDYDYQTVKSERDDYKDHGMKAKYMIIFKTDYDAGQSAIDEQIKKIPIPA